MINKVLARAVPARTRRDSMPPGRRSLKIRYLLVYSLAAGVVAVAATRAVILLIVGFINQDGALVNIASDGLIFLLCLSAGLGAERVVGYLRRELDLFRRPNP
jgi:hypothetical protein